MKRDLNIMLFGLTFSLLICFSCYQDVIDLDLDEVEPRVVIEGYINDQSPSPIVTISFTGKYDQVAEFIPASGADVQIRDDRGLTASFNEIQPGVYRADNFQGREGRTYTLIVNVNGKRYEASSSMPEAIELVDYRFNINGPSNSLTCSFRDREGGEDYCRFKIYKNGWLAERYLYQGRYTDGELIVLDEFDVNFFPGDVALIEVQAIDQKIYEYFVMLNELDADEDGDDGDDYNPEMPEFFPATVFNPKSNFNNNALGYFSAFSLRYFSLRVRS